MITYRMSRHVIGCADNLDISSDQYEELKLARKALTGIAEFEEKFFAICECYFDLEQFIFEKKFNNLLYFGSREDDLRLLRVQFSRRLFSILTIFRLYADSIFENIRLVSGEKISKDEITTIFSKQYDTRFSYRVMEAIRNYSQHASIPAHVTRTQSDWSKDSAELQFDLRFYFKTSRIERPDKFKSSVKKEIEKQGGEIELVNTARDYFFGICEIHSEIRNMISDHRLSAIKILDGWRDEWARAFPEGKVSALAVWKRENDRADKNSVIWLDPEVDGYREFLEERTRHLKNMHKRRVSK